VSTSSKPREAARAQASEDSCSLLSVVVGGGRLLAVDLVPEHSVDEEGELSRRGGDGFGVPDSGAHAAVEGGERVITSSEAHGRHAKDLGRPLFSLGVLSRSSSALAFHRELLHGWGRSFRGQGCVVGAFS
jgi:hypothetical protein